MKTKLITQLAIACSLSLPALSYAIDFTGVPYVLYGDGKSYSLPITEAQCLAVAVDPDVCAQYEVQSSPGQIKDLIVLGTGSSGTTVTTNYDGQDKAYATPNSSALNYFSTAINADPGDSGDPINNNLGTAWDASLESMNDFLIGSDMVFFFNNNQVNSGDSTEQSLAAWAQLWITDPNGDLVGDVYEFTNDNSVYALVSEGGGGTPFGDPAAYSSGVADPSTNNPDGDGTNADTDYVLSGGAICINNNTGALVSCDPGDPDVSAPFNHNLGANEVAYAIIFDELNAQMASLFGSLTDAELALYTLHVDFRLGCDPALYGTDPDAAICAGDPNTGANGKNINNGFEQLFIGRTEAPPVVNVPEPATIALLGTGLLGMAITRRRTRRKTARIS